MKTNLTTEFGVRLVTLRDGRQGLRGGMRCEVKAPEGLIEGEPELDFVATDETLDRYNEVIKLDGWQLDNFRRNPVVVDSHDYSSVLKILGSAPSLAVTGGKMVNRVRFALDNPLGAIAYKMSRAGFIKSQSVGFIPIAWKNGVEKNEPERIYLQQELIEISLVAVPANPGATIGMALKSGAIQKADLKELEQLLKTLCNEPAGPDAEASATGLGTDVAQLLPLARELRTLLKRA